MKTNGDKVRDITIIKKILCTLPSRFDYIVVFLEESKDLTEITINDLQSSLEAYEYMLKERNSNNITKQTFSSPCERKKP